ncbi:MAG: alpha/beta hydrolase [Candidatus Micrarchaeota archaeon]
MQKIPKETSIRANHRQIILILLLFLVIALVFFQFYKPDSKLVIDAEGRIHYPAERGAISATEELLSNDGAYLLYGISYDSNGTKVYGKLWIPNSSGKHAAILFLPGAGVTKDAGLDYANMLRGKGIAVLAIDQRGMGETAATGTMSLQDEFNEFILGREYGSILMVYDALRAFDYLRQRPDIDGNKIAVAGESMGGRNAIIAGAIEKRFRIVMGISTGGYGMPLSQNANATRFLRTFDPENYIGMIVPRKTVIIHSTEDGVQPFEIGKRTFERANEPKIFYAVGCKTHGLCQEMFPIITKEIAEAIG